MGKSLSPGPTWSGGGGALSSCPGPRACELSLRELAGHRNAGQEPGSGPQMVWGLAVTHSLKATALKWRERPARVLSLEHSPSQGSSIAHSFYVCFAHPCSPSSALSGPELGTCEPEQPEAFSGGRGEGLTETLPLQRSHGSLTVGGGWPGFLMSCLKGPHVILKMEAMKMVHPEKFPELQAATPCFPPAPRPAPALAPKRAWPSDTEIIVNQACGGDMPALEGAPCTPPIPRRPPRVLSCLHSVCEQCLQILYESCPKYKFISCPTCRRETVLFTDYGLAALAINTSILSRLPPEALTAPSGGQWGGEPEGSCYQTFRQYCGAACTCHARNPLSACSIM
nr:PREDICTED: RING finger protein 208 [Bos mutus]